MLFVSHQTNQWEVGALGNGDFVQRVSCGEDPRRYDHVDSSDAEGTDLLCVSREICSVEAARTGGERNMCRLSRFTQQ